MGLDDFSGAFHRLSGGRERFGWVSILPISQGKRFGATHRVSQPHDSGGTPIGMVYKWRMTGAPMVMIGGC